MRAPANLTMKLAASVLVIVCLVLGVAGLVLPIIPGLVFLAVAAVIAARHFPRFDARMRRHPRIGGVIDTTDRFLELSWPRKLQCAVLLGLKGVLDMLALAGTLIGRLLGARGAGARTRTRSPQRLRAYPAAARRRTAPSASSAGP